MLVLSIVVYQPFVASITQQLKYLVELNVGFSQFNLLVSA